MGALMVTYVGNARGSDVISGACWMVSFGIFRYLYLNGVISINVSLGCYGCTKSDLGPSQWGKIYENGAIAAQLTGIFRNYLQNATNDKKPSLGCYGSLFLPLAPGL